MPLDQAWNAKAGVTLWLPPETWPRRKVAKPKPVPAGRCGLLVRVSWNMKLPDGFGRLAKLRRIQRWSVPTLNVWRPRTQVRLSATCTTCDLRYPPANPPRPDPKASMPAMLIGGKASGGMMAGKPSVRGQSPPKLGWMKTRFCRVRLARNSLTRRGEIRNVLPRTALWLLRWSSRASVSASSSSSPHALNLRVLRVSV